MKPCDSALIDATPATRKMTKVEPRYLTDVDITKKMGAIDFNLSRLFGKPTLTARSAYRHCGRVSRRRATGGRSRTSARRLPLAGDRSRPEPRSSYSAA